MIEMSLTGYLICTAVLGIYGWIMYNRGAAAGVRDFLDMLHESGIVKDKKAMYRQLQEFYDKQEEDEG